MRIAAGILLILLLAAQLVLAQAEAPESRFDQVLGSLDGPGLTRTAAEWRSILTDQQYRVLREKESEPAGSGKHLNNTEDGIYSCAGCDSPLFESEAKYDARTGWPSFTKPISETALDRLASITEDTITTGILCTHCGGHIGHVFNDGPAPTGQRYSANSLALNFLKDTSPKTTETAVFGAGCFWGTEAVFEKVNGVVSVTVGYAGGHTVNPTHERVSTGKTGHAEVVRVEYDPTIVAYKHLLATFWKMHDPTTKDRQGADIGPQYRSAIFYVNDDQKRLAEKTKELIEKAKKHKNPITTEIWPLGQFFEAEPIHQDYSKKNNESAYCSIVIRPNLRRLGLLEPPTHELALP